MRTNTKSTKKSVAKSTKKSVAKSTKKVAAKSTKKVAAKSTKKVAAKSTKKVAAKPTKKVAAKPIKKIAAKPIKKIAAKPTKKPVAKSTKSPAARSSEAEPTSDAALRALPAEYEANPDMPVKVAQQELASLARLAQTVAGPLAKVGITRLHIATMGRFAQRLGLVEAGWQKARMGVALSTAARKQRFEAEVLDAKLLAGGRWACRKDSEALRTLDRIADGSGLTDTIADLHDLVAFWAEHPRELACTDITARDLTRATALAVALEVAAEKENQDLDAAAALTLRNRCFWAADELAKELREGGRYAFRLQPKMAAKFTSRYRSTLNRRNRSKTAADQPAPTPASTNAAHLRNFSTEKTPRPLAGEAG